MTAKIIPLFDPIAQPAKCSFCGEEAKPGTYIKSTDPRKNTTICFKCVARAKAKVDCDDTE